MTAEEWRAIPGWEGYYEASSAGRLRSLDRFVPVKSSKPRRVRGRVLKPRMHKGYLITNLVRDGRLRTRSVHQLVIAAFKGLPREGMVTRHLDGNALNNAIENLEYGTPSENVQDSIAHGTHWLASRSECLAGHAYTPENTGRKPTGARRCLTCKLAAARRARERRREAA